MPSDSTLTLFIPDLFGFQSTLSKLSSEEKSQLPEMEFPVLEKWLSRASFEKVNNQIDCVFTELGLDVEQVNDKPFAALSLLAEKNVDIEFIKESYWLHADPIKLQADGDTALLAGHEEINLSQDEADKLVAQINEHFTDEPWELYTFAPHRWYLRLDKEANLITTPLSKVIGEDISLFGHQGDDTNYWFKIINELQMLIHGSNVNFERESRNMWTANSVWLWGGGQLPKVNLNSDYDKMITDRLMFSGLGYHCGFDVLPLKGNFPDKIKENNNFVVLDDLSECVQRRDLYTFVEELNKLELDFFKTCNKLLISENVGKLKLITDVGMFTITKKQLGRWWKRIKPFSGYLYE